MQALERAPRRNLLACALWVLRFAQRDVVRAWWALLPLTSSSSSAYDHHDHHQHHSGGGGGGEIKGDACVLQMVAFLQLCLEVFEYPGAAARRPDAEITDCLLSSGTLIMSIDRHLPQN